MTEHRPRGELSGDIAIVGMAVNLPGAPDLDTFWANLRGGVESIDRLDAQALAAAGETDETLRQAAYVPAAGRLDGYDMFDADFFGLSPRDAAILDPQHRKFLETAWEALENAGHTAADFDGRVGVFAGCGAESYLHLNLLTHPELVEDLGRAQLRNIGNDKDFLAARVSHALDLTGPSLTVQTACSTALVGVHQAAKALRDGECGLAIVGGVSIEMPQGRGYLWRETDLLSPDGHCRAFDHRAGGTVMGSGAGAVALRRLEDARADGDHIWAVIKGTAINNDGADKAGFFAPSPDGQAEVVGRALDAAGVAPDTIGYVECHGTATLPGDPLEVAGLSEAFHARGAQAGRSCAVGSVQTNVGNLDTAAAVAGLVKTALALHRAEIPPSLNFEAPNPKIDFDAGPFYVNDRLSPWPDRDTPRRACVNTLGIGGTNAHAVLEQAPEPAASEPGLFPFQPIVLSARTEAALEEMSARLAAHLRAHPEQRLADVAFTLMEGRERFETARVLVAETHAEAAALLARPDPARVFTHTGPGGTPEVVFLFPAAPGVAPGVARDLGLTEPVFADWLGRGLDALGALAGEDLRGAFATADERSEEAARRLAVPSLHDPLAVVLGVAMAELYMSWDVTPDALFGTGPGEIAAAVVAGVMGYEEAIGLAFLGGRLRETRPGEARTAADAVLRGFAAGRQLKAPERPLVSPRTGAAMTPEEATDPETWATPRAGDGAASALEALAQRSGRVFLGLARADSFATWLATAGAGELSANRALAALAAPGAGVADDVQLIATLARLRALGVDADWGQFWAGARRLRLPLPGYAFQRSRHLVEPGRAAAPAARPEPVAPPAPPAPRRHDDIRDWGWRPVWHPAYAACEYDVQAALDQAPKHSWLLFEDGEGIAAAVATRLEGAGHAVVRVTPGDRFAQTGPRRYSLPLAPDDAGYAPLFASLAEHGLAPSRIAHFWGVTPAGTPPPGADPLHDRLDRGFHSLAALARALDRAARPGPVHVVAVTRGAASVNGGPAPVPDLATIAGPAAAIGRELPGVTCATLDLEAPAPARKGLFARAPKPDHDALALRVLEDLLAEPTNEVAAYRGTRRYRQGFRKVALEPAAAAAFRDGGTYLVTGGLGAPGLDIARALIARHRARVVLTDRMALPPRDSWDELLAARTPGDRSAQAMRGIQELELLGGEIEIAAADAADRAAMQAVVTSVTERHGRIDGVVHAAGLAADRRSDLRDAAGAGAGALPLPGVEGLAVLDRLFPDGATDLVVLFSSTLGATRDAGAAGAIATSACLDAFAASRQGGATRVVAIDWGPVPETGETGAPATAGARAVDDTPAGQSAAAPAAPAAPVDAPLLDEAGTDPQGAWLFRTRWQGAAGWLLQQHRTAAGAGLMPLSGIVELVAEAFVTSGGAMPFEIRGLEVSRPFVVEVPTDETGAGAAPRTALRMTPDGARWRVELTGETAAGGRSAPPPLAMAEAAPVDAAAPPPVDLGAVALRCQGGRLRSAPDGGHLAAPLDGPLDLGPAWRALRDSALGRGEGLARLVLPAAAAETGAAGTILHPALLDLGVTFGLELAPGYTPGGLWLPEHAGTVRVFGPLPAELASWVRLADAPHDPGRAAFDVTLCDLAGNVLVEIADLRMRRVDPGAALAPVRETTPGPARAAGRDPEAAEAAAPPAAAPPAAAPMTADARFDALERALALDLPRVLVSAVDLAELIAEADRVGALGDAATASIGDPGRAAPVAGAGAGMAPTAPGGVIPLQSQEAAE